MTRQIRVQVKSRYATDCDHGFPVKEKTFTAFDFLIAAFLNIGNFGGKRSLDGKREPEFYTFPVSFIQEHHDKSSSWEKVRLGNLDIERYKNDLGFELIADALGIPYPMRPELEQVTSAARFEIGVRRDFFGQTPDFLGKPLLLGKAWVPE